MRRGHAIHVSENSQTRRTHVAFLPAREHGSSRTERFALPASVPATEHVLRRWRAMNAKYTRLASEVLRFQEVLEDGRCGAGRQGGKVCEVASARMPPELAKH